MPKPDRNLTELKRQVRLLLALEGRVLRLASGIWLVRAGRVLDPMALSYLIAEPAVSRNALKACLAPDAVCEPLSRQHLAAATHALAVLDIHRDELASTPARWLGGQRRDANWLQAQRRRVERLSAWLGAAAEVDRGTAQLVRLTSTSVGPASPIATRALHAWLDVDTLPALDTRGAALAWLCEHAPSGPLGLDALDEPGFRQGLERVAAHGPYAADSAAALLLATRGWSVASLDAWWPWLAQGIAVNSVSGWPESRGARAAAAPPREWPLAAVRVYVRLAAALLRAPGGSRLRLTPASFARVAAARKPTLVALAAVLEQLLRDGASEIEQTLALADTALRLDSKLALPASAPTQTGLAAQLEAGFAEWIGDSELVDRYLSLRLALNESASVSLRLRQDHAAVERSAAQRRFLESLTTDDPRRAQLTRLTATADPTRTRRRLRAECANLELRWRMAAVDRALRETLARVLGTSTPRWDEAWRDAARLYLGVDRNHQELKALLRAAAAGSGEDWRRQLPGNAEWLQRAEHHLDVDAWLAPPTHAFPWRGETCTLAAERDPLQALRMGLPFDSCLALDDGCNRHSAIINALDVNKWVVYLRDHKGRILARQLLAVSSGWQLLGYRVYTSIGAADGLIDAFHAYARAIASNCGMACADHGVPETLNGDDWYDDGTWAWRADDSAERPQQLAAYAATIGSELPTAPTAEFIDEARRWSLAREGHVEALQTWCDTRPSGLRNYDLLQGRYGRGTLLRLLGDGHRRDRYQYELQREAPLGTLLNLRRQLHDPRRIGFGRDLGDNVFDTPTLRRALRELLQGPTATFDDDGLEHALLTLMPRWAETLPFAELATQLPLLAMAFDRLRQGLPEDCHDCVGGAECALLLALRAAWRRQPDRARMLRLLAARHPTPRLSRWLLALGAREHLSAPAALPLFAAPHQDRGVLRAIDGLVARCPPLRSDPLRLAATLRHSDPATLAIDAVEWPDVAPWQAIGDAICDWPTLWPALRRYARRPGDVSACSLFEVHWARQVRTAWHHGLPEQVAALDEASVAAARIVAGLGMAELIEASRHLLRRHAHRARRQRQRAAEIHQLLGCADPEGGLGGIRRAWQRLQMPDAPDAAVAAVRSHPEARALTDALVDLTQPPSWGGAFLRLTLPGTYDARRCLRLWQHPTLHDLTDLAEPQAWSASHARRVLQQWPADLGEHWLIRMLAAGNTDLVDDGPVEWYQRLAGLAAGHCTPAARQTLFEALPDALSASVFRHIGGPRQPDLPGADASATCA